MIPNLYAYLLSFAFTTVLIVYTLNVPTIVTGEKELVKTYYLTNYKSNLILDVFLIAIYLSIAEVGIRYWKLSDIWKKLVMVVLVTCCISSAFYMYFISTPKTSHFFSRWFHTVGFNAVIYDMILVTATYFTYDCLLKKFTL
jgi:Na+/glutamate symporter